jgi:hypothetical protein
MRSQRGSYAKFSDPLVNDRRFPRIPSIRGLVAWPDGEPADPESVETPDKSEIRTISVLSGVVYRRSGLTGCLGASAAFAGAAALLAMRLPRTSGAFELPEGAKLGGE